MTDVKNDKDLTLRLSGGQFVVLGRDTYADDGSLRYAGQFGVKYGSDKTDWVRLSYSDLAVLVKWILENKKHVNAMIALERRRMTVSEL